MIFGNYSTTNNTTVAFVTEQKHFKFIYYFVPLYATVFLLGTFGNGLVIISVLRSLRLRTVTNIYLLNVAIADFALLLSVPFLIVTLLANGWIFGNILCKMYYNLIHINQYVSSLLLAALSFDRYLAVCHPIRAIEFRTRTKCVLIVGGCWLVSILFLCPTWVFATVTSEQYVVWFGCQVQKCVIDFPSLKFRIPPEIIFTYYAFLLGFLIPVSMITTFYILVIKRLKRIRQKHKSGAKERSHRRVTRIVLAVVTAYFICWLPYWFLQIFITVDPLLLSLRPQFSNFTNTKYNHILKELTHLTTIIGYANNCLNPVLYVFLSDSFREEYVMILKCFNANGMFMRYELNYGNEAISRQERKADRQTAFQLANLRQMGIRNLNHSVAFDDMPSQFGSCSSFGQRHNDQKCQLGSSTPLRINEPELHRVVPATQSPPNSLTKTSGSEKIQSSMGNLLALPLHPSSRVTDDGGVYCGE